MIKTINNLVFGKIAYGEAFVFEIDTRNTLSGSSNNNQYQINFDINTADNDINYIIDWGDGSITPLISKTDSNRLHSYLIPGIYKISIVPIYSTLSKSIRILFNSADRNKLLRVLRWGSYQFFSNCFQNCPNLRLSDVSDIPKFVHLIVNWVGIFNGTAFPNINRLSEWQFSSADKIGPLVYSNANFNQNITINAPVATTLIAFWLCPAFNGDIILNAPNLEDISQCFRGATAFNKDISTLFNWSKIKNMTNFMTGKTSANYNPTFYSNMLIAMNDAGMSNVVIGMGAVKYTSAGISARAGLVSRGCTITDGGLI